MHFFLPRGLLSIIFAVLIANGAKAQFVLRDDATLMGNGCVQLTPALVSQLGAMVSDSPVDITNGFEFQTQMFFGAWAGGADGASFFIVRTPTPPTPQGGGFLGSPAITPSFILEFDTFFNAIFGDIAPDHLGLHRDGTLDHTNGNALTAPTPALASLATLKDNTYHDVRISYDHAAQTFEVYIDCDLRISHNIDLINDIFGGLTDSIYWGFAAATGGLTNEHSICIDYANFLPDFVAPDQNLCDGDTAQIFAVTNAATFSWSPNYNIDNVNSLFPRVWPAVDTTYTITGQNACGDVWQDSVQITIVPRDTPSVAIVASDTTPCPGDLVTFTVTDSSGGGPDPQFVWGVNGLPAGGDNYQFTTAVNDLDQVGVLMISNDTCVANMGLDTALIVVHTIPITPMNLAISVNPASVCEGDSVFLAITDSTGGGADPSFQWFVNAAPTGGDQNSLILTPSAVGDTVSVTMTSNAACVVGNTHSDGVAPVINPIPAATVLISGSTVCQDSAASITVTDSTGGGPGPTFTWYHNGVLQGTNSFQLTIPAASNGDTVSVMMTSNAPCGLTDSTSTTLTTVANVDATIAISYTADSICAGDVVQIVVTDSTGSGPNPSFQWYRNGVPFHSDSNTFTSSTLADLDSIAVVVISNFVCPAQQTDTADVVMEVVPVIPLNLTIASSPVLICEGDTMFFDVTDSTGGGPDPTFQWFVNTTPSGGDSFNFFHTPSVMGDSVSVTMTSNATCTAGSQISTGLRPVVTPVPPASVASVVNTPDICEDSSAVITVTDSTGGGANPTFTWYHNGAIQPGSDFQITLTSVSNADIVSVVMQSNAICGITDSTAVNVSTITNVDASVQLSMSLPSICPGEFLTATVTDSTGSGTNPDFQWYLNGAPIHTNTFSYSSNTYVNSDSLSVVITSNYICPADQTDTASVSIVVNPPAKSQIIIEPRSVVFCDTAVIWIDISDTNNAGPFPTLEWYVNGSYETTSWAPYTAPFLMEGDSVQTILVTNHICYEDDTSSLVGIQTVDCECRNIFIPTAISPNGDAKNDTWMIGGLDCAENHEIRVYNRYGMQVYQSYDYTLQWDGTYKGNPLPVGVYYYVISYLRYGESNHLAKTGTITIMR